MFDYFKKTFHWWDGVFTKRSVTELLFGYDDPMLLSLKKDIDIIKKFPFLHNIAVDVDPRFNYSVSMRPCSQDLVDLLYVMWPRPRQE